MSINLQLQTSDFVDCRMLLWELQQNLNSPKGDFKNSAFHCCHICSLIQILVVINIKSLLKSIKIFYQAVRTAAIQLIGVLHMYMGQTLRMFFEDEKAALLQQIDAEIEKVRKICIPCFLMKWRNRLCLNVNLNILLSQLSLCSCNLYIVGRLQHDTFLVHTFWGLQANRHLGLYMCLYLFVSFLIQTKGEKPPAPTRGKTVVEEGEEDEEEDEEDGGDGGVNVADLVPRTDIR